MTHILPDWNQIVLNGMRLEVEQAVADSNLALLQNKVTIGDYTKDSNPILSAWVVSDLTGGLGVEEMNEGPDITRYRLGTFNTIKPGQITKAPKVTNYASSIVSASNNIRFLGNVRDDATGEWDLVLSGIPSTLEIESQVNGTMATTLTTEPVNNCVVYQGTSGVNRLVIPLGEDGFATYSSAGVVGVRAPGGTAAAGTPALQAVVVWDNKLIGIDIDGQLWRTTNPLTSSDNWVSYGATAKLPTQVTARGMATYFDRQGIPAVFIITDTDVWQFDAAGPNLFTVDVSFPPHPHHGLAMCKWGGDLYFSVGIGVHRYTGGSLAAMGLDRDHGLPIEYAGYIVGGGLVAGYNSMYAFVTAPDLSGYTFVGDTPSAYSGVYEFTGTGWHMVWESATESIIPHSMGISRVDGVGDAFVLFWGTSDTTNTASYLHQINLPIAFLNPRQRSRVEDDFATDGWMETGIFDAGMKGYNKLFSGLDVEIGEMATDAVLTVKYKINGADDWTTLGTVTEEGITSLPFGTLSEGIYPGAVGEHIQYRFDLDDDSNDGFVMESFTTSFLKLMPPINTWTTNVVLRNSEEGMSPADIVAALDDILSAGVMVPLVVHGEETKRVFLSQVRGARETGTDERAFRTITLMEIPQTLGAADAA